MFILFGWGHQTIKRIGVAFKKLCSHCHNDDYWILTRTTTWFTLFFIPVIPYSVKYFLFCPICEYGLTLDNQQLQQIKPLAEINQLLIDGKITPDEHQARLNQLDNGSPEPVQTKVVEAKSLTDGNVDNRYCVDCGAALTENIKFCGSCGTEIVAI